MSRLNALHQRWQQLAARERRALGLLALVLSALLLYSQLWLPLQLRLEQARQHFIDERELFMRLQASSAYLLASQAHKGNNLPTEQLHELVTRSATDAGLTIERYDYSSDGLNISLGRVPLRALPAWFDRLEQQGAQRARINLQGDPSGTAELRLTLRASP